MPLLDPTYVLAGVVLLAAVLAVLWPANSRRWGTEITMPPDPVWEPWACEDVFLVLQSERTDQAATYRVGEIIETSDRRRQIGDGR